MKKSRRIIYFLLSAALCSSDGVQSSTPEPSNIDTSNFLKSLTQKHPVYKFSLPINEEQNISANFMIPEELIFKYQQPGNPYFIQYGDAGILFSISSIRGEKLQSLDLIKKGMAVLRSNNAQLTILEKADHNYSSYSDGYRILKRLDPNTNKMEIVYFYVASGPFDSVSVLYEKNFLDHENIEQLLKMIKQDFKTKVKIMGKDSQ
ncbi:hypothetical protein [Legionella sp. km772]|uniref:hypothetical protein n=1 Tax=Legionella sp. km772 TaxID=2498111 RepID=UPI000F8ED969|nr:hypothetical protein [Legionella sp. km772]RUR05374.1 hypothetical protein ELY15_14390 [Legionella sp. km772]